MKSNLAVGWVDIAGGLENIDESRSLRSKEAALMLSQSSFLRRNETPKRQEVAEHNSSGEGSWEKIIPSSL